MQAPCKANPYHFVFVPIEGSAHYCMLTPLRSSPDARCVRSDTYLCVLGSPSLKELYISD